MIQMAISRSAVLIIQSGAPNGAGSPVGVQGLAARAASASTEKRADILQ